MQGHMSDEGREGVTEYAPVPRGELRGYAQLKFALAELIREIKAFAREQHDENLERQTRELQKRLAGDRFNLAVVGQFSRGKSTLMNALLGMDRLPTGIVPVTSVITSVSYSTRERVVLRYENSSLTRDVPLMELSTYVTEQGNPGNKMKIQVADVQLPAELLQRGFYFVDTPGLGSAIFANTQTTRRFFPECDAAIFVTAFDSPLSAEELASFEEVARYVRNVFLVINKLDLVSSDQRDHVMNFVQKRLQEIGTVSEVEIFPLSAQRALRAKLENNEQELSQTGLPQFERSLIDFLTTRKTRDFLALMCDRTAALLTNMPEELRRSLLTQLSEIHMRVTESGKAGHVDSGLQISHAGSQFSPLEALAACPICDSVLNASFEFLSQYQYDLSTNLGTQTSHAAKNGFCASHTWQYERIASPQGICSAYPKTVQGIAEKCREVSHGAGSGVWRGDSLVRIFLDHKHCPVCKVANDAEEQAIKDVAAQIEDPSSSNTGTFPNLCLPHLCALAPNIRSDVTMRDLLIHEAKVLDQLGESMQRFTLKHEGLSMHLAKEEERKAPKQTLKLLVGHPNSRNEAPR